MTMKPRPRDRLWRLHKRGEGRHSVSLWVDGETMNRLNALSAELNISVSGIVAQMVRHCLSTGQGPGSHTTRPPEAKPAAEPQEVQELEEEAP
jgi:hypothetical protein